MAPRRPHLFLFLKYRGKPRIGKVDKTIAPPTAPRRGNIPEAPTRVPRARNHPTARAPARHPHHRRPMEPRKLSRALRSQAIEGTTPGPKPSRTGYPLGLASREGYKNYDAQASHRQNSQVDSTAS